MTPRQRAYLYLLFTFAAWGSLYVVSKVALAYVSVFTVLFSRYLIAGIALAFVLPTRPKTKFARADYKYVLAIGLIGYFLSIAAQLLGTKLAGASLASLVNSMNPVFIILFAAFLLKERITREQVIAVLITLVGTYIVLGGGEGGGQTIGILASLASVVSWAAMSVLVRKVTAKYDPVVVTTYAIWTAMAASFPFCAYEWLTAPGGALLNGWLVAALLYIGLLCTALPHVLWNKSLSMIEAGRCALFYPLQPLTSAFLGWLCLDETISWSFAVGAALIIGGVLFSMTERK